jgi:hypothetical protein
MFKTSRLNGKNLGIMATKEKNTGVKGEDTN